MKIEEIKNIYPKAYEKFHNDFKIKDKLFGNLNSWSQEIYKFFDSQNIIIEILADFMNKDIEFYFKIYNHRVNGDVGRIVTVCSTGIGRSGTEQAAFEKAFEILNDKL